MMNDKNDVITLGPWAIVFIMVIATVLAVCLQLSIGVIFGIGSVGYAAYFLDEYNKMKAQRRNNYEGKIS